MKIPSAILAVFVAILIVLTPVIDAKRKKNKSSSSSASSSPKSKTKTKWSTTMDALPDGLNSLLATEEHGYYVKRTFLAPDGTVRTNFTTSDNSLGGAMKSVPYLAIPIAWFPCPEGREGTCRNGNSAIINSGLNAMSEGFLCDDDCVDAYEPICGRTPTEIAVFYNKCKLNVAKCRTHGYWMDYALDECKKLYGKELEYADHKFKASPFFKSPSKAITEEADENNSQEVISIAKPEVVQTSPQTIGLDAKLQKIEKPSKNEAIISARRNEKIK